MPRKGKRKTRKARKRSLSREQMDELELDALREMVDAVTLEAAGATATDPKTVAMMDVVANFIKDRQLVCYGGTAINNILPPKDQFYDSKTEIPDYDFFSSHALQDAKDLADLYVAKGFEQVEAKTGVHHGTYKVFVDFIPVADVTYVPDELMDKLRKQALIRKGIYYAPPNYLRMAMYLELSRPAGDISRWEKVLKRLSLLNQAYPLEMPHCDPDAFARAFEGETLAINKKLFGQLRDILSRRDVVFFGAYALSLYGKSLPVAERRILRASPDFDVLSLDPETTARDVVSDLRDAGYADVRLRKHDGLGEIVPAHVEILVGRETVCFVYHAEECHSYNTITVRGREVKVATIATILRYYLAFIYADRPYYDPRRLLCMAQYLLGLRMRNRLATKGILNRFTPDCFGTQHTMADARLEKTKMFDKLKDKRGTEEYESWFLNYKPEARPRARGRRTRRR